MAKILIVDDDEKDLKLYQDILLKEGFKVLVATNGRDGLKIAEREIPNLILLDVMMPEVDGGQVAQNLLENTKTKNIPIIFLTSIITKEEEAKVERNIAGRTYLSKGSNPKEIIEKINEILGIGR